MCRLNSNNFNMKLPENTVVDDELYFSDDLDDTSPPSSPVRNGDFSEYMWMEHEDEFDSAVMRQLEEEELIDECVTEMVIDEMNSTRTNDDNNANGIVLGMQELNVIAQSPSVNMRTENTSVSSSNTPSVPHSARNGHVLNHASTSIEGPSQSNQRISSLLQNRLNNVRYGLPRNAPIHSDVTASEPAEEMFNGYSDNSNAIHHSHGVPSEEHSAQLVNDLSPSTLNPNAKEFIPSSLADLPGNNHEGGSLH